MIIDSLTENEKADFIQNKIAEGDAAFCNLLFKQTHKSGHALLKKLKITEKKFSKQSCNFNLQLRAFLIDLYQNKQPNTVSFNKAQLLSEHFKQRGFYYEAQIKVDEALLLAKKNERFREEIDLLRQRIQLLRYVKMVNQEDELSTYLDRLQWLDAQQKEETQLLCFYQQLVLLRYKMAFRTTQEEQKDILQLKACLELYIPDALYSVGNKIYYYLCILLSDYMLGKHCNAKELNAALLKCWQENSQLISLHEELFIRSVSVQSYTHFMINDIASAQNSLTAYRQLAEAHLHTSFYKLSFQIIDFNTNIKVLHKKYLYNELGQTFLPQWQTIYNTLWVIPETEKLDIIVSGSITYFVLEKWTDSESLMLEAKELNHKVKRADTLYFTFIFHCLILFEQKEWSRLDNLINTEYHFLYKNNKLRPFEKDMLLFIKKLPIILLKENRKQNLQAFLYKLDEYKEDDIKKLHFAYFDFYSWVESKIYELGYASFLKKKAHLDLEVTGA